MTAERFLTARLVDALPKLTAGGAVVRVVAVTPPAGAATAGWRVARVVPEKDGSLTVTAVAEIEGTIGCNECRE